MTQESRFSRMDPEVRKANLVQATLTCLKPDGFQGASIRKISAEAGVSVGLISHHYSGKDELVAEAYRTITGQVMSLLRETMAKAPPNPRERLSALFRGSFSAELLDPHLLDAWLVFWGAVKTAPAINLAHEHSYGEYRTIMRSALTDMAKEEGWKQIDADLAAIGLSALLDGLWLESGSTPVRLRRSRASRSAKPGSMACRPVAASVTSSNPELISPPERKVQAGIFPLEKYFWLADCLLAEHLFSIGACRTPHAK